MSARTSRASEANMAFRAADLLTWTHAGSQHYAECGSTARILCYADRLIIRSLNMANLLSMTICGGMRGV